ncbi:MAG: hypothetical protein JOY79_06885 [Acidobacteriaceae bacterium]|nr:hypothetical protein [Acidobacteriaceae bacterium]
MTAMPEDGCIEVTELQVRQCCSGSESQQFSESALPLMGDANSASLGNRGDPLQFAKARQHRAAELSCDVMTAFSPVETLTSEARLFHLLLADSDPEFRKPRSAPFC